VVQIEFWGAAGEVTGSCHLVRVGDRRVLLDCGLIQGGPEDEARNRAPFPFAPAEIDAVVLSHAHLDHSGRLPLLAAAGFRGPIYAHTATRDLCEIMLRDAAYLNEKDTEHENRRRARRGLAPLAPLYTRRAVERLMQQFRPLDYGLSHEILPGIRLRLHDAGHILGSAIVVLEFSQAGGTRRRLAYSGDLGHRGAPILRNPETVREADLVVLESTYGDRDHRSWEATLAELAALFLNAEHSKGNVLVPAFAVGRSQELLYLFKRHYRDWALHRWRIFLDSPLAIEATEIYARHWQLYDKEATRLRAATRRSLFELPNLVFTRTTAQSMALNRIAAGAVIIAGSGMCDGGRIRHHLKHNIWRPHCHLLITGYQARGTLGRRLVDGAGEITLWGEPIRVAAEIHTIGGLSAHAGQQALVDWYAHFHGRPPVALVHGETHALEALAARLAALGARVTIPKNGERLAL
jgi:metallo-beta-lactamase family protein